MELLFCTVCLTVKPKSAFYARKESTTGYRRNCKKCVRDLQKRERGPRKKLVPDVCYIRPQAKNCLDCGEWKSGSEFGAAPERTDGLRAYCKSCCAEREKHRAATNQFVPISEKECVTCKIVKPSSEFSIARRVSTGLRGTCSQCEYEKALRSGYQLKKYGLTTDDYQSLLDKQGGKCPICKSKITYGKAKSGVDHDHSCCSGPGSCGKCVRGILCSSCNSALGFFKDNIDSLQSAIKYLNEYQLSKKENNNA